MTTDMPLVETGAGFWPGDASRMTICRPSSTSSFFPSAEIA